MAKFPWKQRLLKIPKTTRLELHGIGTTEIVVAAVKKVTEAEVNGGLYRHLDIKPVVNGIEFPHSILPKVGVGPWSRTNIEGKEVIRKDLPKYTKTFAVESPNWGDASKYGSHTNYFEREVYPRDLVPPKYLEIEIELIDTEETATGSIYVLKFSLNEVLDTTDPDFDEELLYNLNVLQENIGRADVFKSTMTLADYRATILINWEILPPGEREENLAKILSGIRSTKTKDVVKERYNALEDLNPTAIIKGVGGFQRYFGAVFADDLVVFENAQYGNAIYVMFDDWKELSKKSRTELLRGDRDGFERIVHSAGWQKQLEMVITDNRD